MTDVQHSDAEPTPERADAAAQARGENASKRRDEDQKPCSPAEAEANAEQAAQRAS